MIALYRKLALRHLLNRKRRSTVTILAIALGVTLVVAVGMTSRSITERYEELIGGIAGRADFQVRANGGNGFPAGLLTDVARTPGVQAAVPVVSSGSSVVHGDSKARATIYGVDPVRDVLIRDYRLTAGRLVDSPGEIAVTDELAGQLHVQVGENVNLLGPTGFTSLTLVGIFDAKGTVRGSFGPFGVMPLRDAQDLFAKIDVLDAIDVLVASGFQVRAVEEAVKDQVAGRAVVASPLERTAGLERTLNSIFSMLVIAGWISLFAAAFIIYTNVSMSVVERRKSLAIMRSLGMRRREVVGLVLSEVVSIGLLASGIGLALGYGLARGLMSQVTGQLAIIAGAETAALGLTGQDLVMGLGLGLGMSLVAALVPTWATVRIDPVEAMRPDNGQPNGELRGNVMRPIVGLVLLAAPALLVWRAWPGTGEVSTQTFQVWGASAVVMLLGAALIVQSFLARLSDVLFRPLLLFVFGVTGRLAADNLARQPRRAAASSLALMVALAYMVGMGGFAAAMADFNEKFIERTLGWDLWVATSNVGPSSALVDLPGSMGAELARVPGVTVVDPEKFSVASLSDGHPMDLRVFDFKVLTHHTEMLLVQGDQEEAVAAMQRGGGAIISTGLARELRLNVGDRISIPSPSGVQKFTIVAVDQEPGPAGGAVLLDRQDYLRYWKDDTVTAFVLKTEPERQEEVRQAILARWGESLGLVVTLKDEFGAEVRQAINGLTGMITGLAWLSVAIAGLAVANTLFSNLMERMREFGALRAVGARRRDVYQVVVGEALATGVIGGALGIACGLGLYTLFVRSSELLTGFPANFAVPWVQIGMALVAALVLAPLVGLLPARWAARIEIVEALQYE